MALAKENHSLKQLVTSAFGQSLLACELSFVATWLNRVGGVEMVVTGIVDPLVQLSDNSAVVHKTFVFDSFGEEEFPVKTAVVAAADNLPFRSDSIDLLIALHTLQQVADPRRMVREAERVLAPEGRVIFSGLNPYSLAGLWSLSKRGKLLGEYPVRRCITKHKLCDWLLLLGLEIEKTESFGHRPPLGKSSLLDRLEFLDKAGVRLWPFMGAGYLVQARKHVSNPVPLGPVRNWRTRLAPDGVVTSFNRKCVK